jgi:hypothetical protein
LGRLAAGTEPPGGYRSETQHEPKRLKCHVNLKKALDSLVGSSEVMRPLILTVEQVALKVLG